MELCVFFSSRRRHTRYWRDWSSDVCSSDLEGAEDLGRYVDEELVLGIRPEHIEDAQIAEPVDGAATIDVQPQVIESMGNEKYVYFELPHGGATARTPSTEEVEAEIGAGADQVGDLLVARLSPQTEAREGREVRLLIDASK